MITIVTICCNNLSDLIQTCQSIDSQSQKNFEHLIINGSTTEEINSYFNSAPAPLPNYRHIIHEIDNGISDAFNKGIRNAKGDIIVLLNSGDVFIDETTIDHVYKEFESNPSISWLHGLFEYTRADNQVLLGVPFNPSKLYRGMRRVCHQSMYVKKEVYERVGLYDLNEKIAMDYDLLCRLVNEPSHFMPFVLVKFKSGGTSEINYIHSLFDQKRIYEKYFGYSYKQTIWRFRNIFLHYLLKSTFGKTMFGLKKKLGLENY